MPRFLHNPWFLLGLGLWQLVVVFTPVSLYGLWQDAIFLSICSIGIVYGLFARTLEPSKSTGDRLLLVAGALVSVPLILFGLPMIAFGLINTARAEDVPGKKKVDGIWLERQYFQPRVLMGCGYGSLSTAKTLVFFPVIEYRTEFVPCTDEDRGCFIEKGSWEACGY